MAEPKRSFVVLVRAVTLFGRECSGGGMPRALADASFPFLFPSAPQTYGLQLCRGPRAVVLIPVSQVKRSAASRVRSAAD